MNRYTSPPTATAQTAEPFMVSTTEPLRASRVESEVVVPFLQTGVTALAVTGALVFVSWRADWPWDVPVGGGLIVFVAMWVWRILRSDALLWRLERMTGRELDGKPGLGKPHDVTLLNMGDYTPPAPNLPDMMTDGGTPTKRALLSFVMSCYVMGKTSERAHGIKPWQRGRYIDFRDSLIDELRLAQWDDATNHNLGWHMIVDQDTALRMIDDRVL